MVLTRRGQTRGVQEGVRTVDTVSDDGRKERLDGGDYLEFGVIPGARTQTK